MNIHLAPETIVFHPLGIYVAIVVDRFGEGNGKVSVVLASPSIGDTITGEKCVIDHPQVSPECLPLIVIYASP